MYLKESLPDPSKGYCEGVDESKNLLLGVSVQTNSLILDTALYVIQH